MLWLLTVNGVPENHIRENVGTTLENTGFKTLYFNAWTTDYSDDALMAIVSELKELSPQDDNTCNKIATGAARILLSVGKGMFKK